MTLLPTDRTIHWRNLFVGIGLVLSQRTVQSYTISSSLTNCRRAATATGLDSGTLRLLPCESPRYRFHTSPVHSSSRVYKASRSHVDDDDSRRKGIRIRVSTLLSRVIPLALRNNDKSSKAEFAMLQQENDLLRKTIHQLELENEVLKSNRRKQPPKIVIETFEGEGKLRRASSSSTKNNGTEMAWFADANNDVPMIDSTTITTAAVPDGLTMTEEELEVTSASFVDRDEDVMLWCDELELDSDSCPIEPNVSFLDALRDRAYWLVGLLALQSCSGLILSHNEELLQSHPVIVYFLTMLVGAGGNAGNQASVRVIRGIALGTLNNSTQGQFLQREFKMALSLSLVLSLAGFTRAFLFKTPLAETIAVTAALAMIVFSSVCLGALLPLLLKKLKIDPAHSSTTIQVVMDILGVFLTVLVSTAILDSPIGRILMTKLS